MAHYWETWRYFEVNSPFLRRALSFFYAEGRPYPIPFGPLRGKKLYYDKRVNFHAILGLWELRNFALLKKVLSKGTPICDVGANLGMYTLWFSQYGEVHAFEPSREIAALLQKNVFLNALTNVEIHLAACSDNNGSAAFYLGHHHHQSSLHAEWAGDSKIIPEKIVVPTTTLDNFYLDQGRTPPGFIKMDIEGGATFALKGATRMAKEVRPLWFIESHTPEEDKAISRLLTGYDYEAYRAEDRKWVRNRDNTHPDRDGVWGSLLVVPGERRAEIERKL